MEKEYNGTKVYYAKDRKALRNWLEKNHAKEEKVWLILYRKDSTIKSVTYPEAVEEALCFGWIDSKPNKRDDESRYQFFAKRKPKSVWSKINKAKIEKLIENGSMTKAGLEAIENAKQNGSWNSLDEVEDYVMHNDFSKALNENKTALRNYNNFPPSSKKIILNWVYSAKRIETRNKRIRQTVELAAKNIRANHYRQ